MIYKRTKDVKQRFENTRLPVAKFKLIKFAEWIIGAYM